MLRHLARAGSPCFVPQNTGPVGSSAYKNKVPRPMKGGKCYILECLFHFAEPISYDLQNRRNP